MSRKNVGDPSSCHILGANFQKKSGELDIIGMQILKQSNLPTPELSLMHRQHSDSLSEMLDKTLFIRHGRYQGLPGYTLTIGHLTEC